MSALDDKYLSALALMKTAFDQHGATYLDYVTPFVGDTIRSVGRIKISGGELRNAIVKRYGLEIPEGVLNTLTRRLARRGFGSRSYGHFEPNQEKLEELYNFDHQRSECQKAINDLADRFISFTKDWTGRSLSRLEAIGALIKYAEGNGLPILSRVHEQTPLPFSLSLDEVEYITSVFVIQSFERDMPEKDTLVMLAKGSKLASVLYLPDPQAVTRRIVGVTALLDTPTLLSALGYQGKEKELAAKDLLDLAYESGVNLAAFDHTIEETKQVLRAAGRRAAQGGYYQRGTWGVDAHFLALRYTASDIEILIGRLENDLRSLRVRLNQRPAFRADWSVDETKFDDKLQEKFGYPRLAAKLHDLQAITAIFGLRKGRYPTRFEYCRAIFVTPNSTLAQVSRDFFRSEYGEHWPLAVTEDEFVTLLWLKRPLTAPDLPERRVVADAYAALEPGFVCWESFLTEIQKLRDNDDLSEEDYVLLRYSSATKDALMNETFGKPGALDARAIYRIQERVRQSIRMPVQEQVDQLTADLAKEQQRVGEQEESFSTRLAAIKQERDEARDQLARLRETKRRNAKQKAARWGVVSRWTLNTSVCLVFLLGAWFSAPAEWKLPPLPDLTVLRWLARGAVFGLLVAGVLNLVFRSWDINRIGRRLEIWVSNRLERNN